MSRIIPTGVQRALVLLSLMTLSGCYTIAQTEYENFAAQPVNKRIMNDIQLSWEIRPDAAEVCNQILNKQKNPNGPAPVACAKWSIGKRHCTIITTPNPNHVVLGHELRHCFEGNFH
jgi:hypothetical protein